MQLAAEAGHRGRTEAPRPGGSSPRRRWVVFGILLGLVAGIAFDAWHLVVEGKWGSPLAPVLFAALTAIGVLVGYFATLGPLRLVRRQNPPAEPGGRTRRQNPPVRPAESSWGHDGPGLERTALTRFAGSPYNPDEITRD